MPLRALVEVRNLQSSAEFQSLEAAVEYAHLKFQSNYEHPAASDIRTVFITANRFFREDPSVIDIDVITFNKNVTSDEGHLSEAKFLEVGKNLAHNSNVTNVFLRVVQYSRAFENTTALSDVDILFVGKKLAESSTAAEQKAISLTKPFEEDLTAVGDFTRNVLFKRVPLENLGTTDSYFRQVDYNREFFDTVYPTDDLDGEASILDDQEMFFVKTRTDMASVAESLTRTVSFNREFSDASAASDIHNFDIGKNEQDTAAASDIDRKDFGKQLDDIGLAAEQFSRIVQFARTPADAAAMTDDAVSSVGKVLTDDGVVSESLTREVQFARQFTDSSATVDQSSLAFGKSVSDSTSTTEQHKFSVSKALLNSSIAIEAFTYSVAKAQADTTNSVDLATIELEKTQTDPVSFADAGSLVSQGYVDNNAYFAEIYVGTSRSF